MKHDVFISHSSKDFELANAICEHLELNKVNVWIAPRDLVPGNSYPSEIINGIKDSSIVLLIFSEKSFNSLPVRKEIERAASLNKTIINFRIENVQLDDEWEYLISNVHWMNATGKDAKKHFAEMLSSIKMQLNIISSRGGDAAGGSNRESTVINQITNEDLEARLDKLALKNKTNFLNSNAHKFKKESYIERSAFTQYYKEHKKSKILFLLGEAGMGKTNEMCHLITQSEEEKRSHYFAFNSQMLDTEIDILLLNMFVDAGFNQKDITIEAILNKMNKYGKETNTQFYFLFDAINEATTYPISDERFKAYPTLQLLKDLHQLFIKEEYSQFSLITSQRSTPFDHLKNRIATELYLDFSKTPVFSLEQFTNDELLCIFENYRKEYDIQTSVEKFKSVDFSRIRSSLASPLLFKLVVQGYEGSFLPEHIEKYDFVEIVKKLMSKNLYESNFNAYELLLRLTATFRKRHIDNLDISRVIASNDEELVALKKSFINESGKITESSDILFRDNYLKFNNGAIRFVYEKVQEALFEISFLTEYESQFERDIIPSKIYEDIVLSQTLEYDVVSYSYLCNACTNNYLRTKDSQCLKNLVQHPEKRIQTLALMLLSKLSHIGYESTSRSLVKDMLNADEPYIIDSALKAISVFYSHYLTVEEFEEVAKTKKSPTEYFIFLFHHHQNDKVLNKAGVFLYNIILQNQHLTQLIMKELFLGFMKSKTININYLMHLGLLSFIVSIDVLVKEEIPIEQRKDYVNQLIIKNWRKIWEKMFTTNSKFYHPNFEKSSKYIGLIPAFLRNVLLRFGIKLAMLKYFNIQTDYTNNLKEYDHFWKKIPLKAKNGKWSKRNFSNISELFDTDMDLSSENSDIILEGVKSGDVFSFMMIERMLIIRGLHNWPELKNITTQAIAYDETDTDYIDYIEMSHCYILFHVIDKTHNAQWLEEVEGEAFDILEKTVYKWSKRTYGRFKAPYIEEVNTTYGVYKQFVINWYIVAACKKAGGDKYSVSHIPIITQMIDEIMASKDKDRDLLFYIIENISVASTNLGKIYTSLALFDYVISKINTEAILDEFNLEKEVAEYRDKQIDEYLVSVLNTMKSFFPAETAQYEADHLTLLAEKGNVLATMILSKSRVITVMEETLGSLLTSRFGNFFVWGLGDDGISDFFVSVLKEAEKKKNDKDWAFMCIQYAFRDLFGFKI